MDFAITLQDDQAQMTFNEAGDIFNNIYLSLTVVKGSFFHNPAFGLRQRSRMKNTVATAALVCHDYKEALQWLIDTGRARSVDVSSERDRRQDLNRLKLLVEVVQADGRTVTFTIFREVV